VIAPFVGSFAATLAIRLPAGRGVVLGRSFCPDCTHILGLRDLVPLLSWLLSRGACRHCGAKISAFYPVIEISALLIAAWAALVVTGWLLWASCVLGWCLLTLATIDARHMILPDVLTLPLAALGLGVAGLLGGNEVIDAGIGAVIGFVAFAAVGWLYRVLRGRDGLGLGDAKLLAAAGAWVGWAGLPSVVGIAALMGLAVAVARGCLGGSLSLTDRLPFGPYLCGAIWLVWLYGPVMVGS
jgi:leader peptidase (prepilin peptidase)/N-methyltransferase